MRLLISTCNHPLPPKNRSVWERFLWEYDTRSDTFTPIPIRHPQLPISVGVTGLARYRDGYVALWQSQTTHIVFLDSEYRVRDVRPLTLTRDGHSLIVRDDWIWLASTGNNSVTIFHPDHGEQFHRQTNAQNRDTLHVNSLAFWNGQLWTTAFGPKTGSSWRESRAGYIRNVTHDQFERTGLAHPHSLVARLEGLYVCESARMSVRDASDRVLHVGRGYTRGLVLTNRWLCVGTSRPRRKSRSTGATLDKPSEGGFVAGECGLALYERNSQDIADSTLLRFSCPHPEVAEIYDIVLVEEDPC